MRTWANALICMHLGDEWTFAFDNAKRRAGLCDYTHKRISVSRYLAARYDDDTNPPDAAARGSRTRSQAPPRATAASGRRSPGISATSAARPTDGETATELAPWVGVCPAGHTAHRHRRPNRPTSCVKCAPRFDARYTFTWTRREITRAARMAAATPR